MTQQVHVEPLDIEQLATIVGAERQVALRAAAQAARSALAGRVIVHVNATATGGGVAELLPPLLGYSRGVGIDARWSVISGNPQFFAVTKRLHNLIHGYGGECVRHLRCSTWESPAVGHRALHGSIPTAQRSAAFARLLVVGQRRISG